MSISESNITRNLDFLGGMILSESVMFHLAAKVGKQTAHQLVHEVTMITEEHRRPFRQRLMESPEIRKVMDPEELESVLDYSKHTGLSESEVHRAVAYCRESTWKAQCCNSGHAENKRPMRFSAHGPQCCGLSAGNFRYRMGYCPGTSGIMSRSLRTFFTPGVMAAMAWTSWNCCLFRTLPIRVTVPPWVLTEIFSGSTVRFFLT